MDELLKAIEELKRAHKASGAKSVKVKLVDGDTKTAEIVVAKTIKLNGEDKTLEVTFMGTEQQKPLTNREWLESLSDDELVFHLLTECLNCEYHNLTAGCVAPRGKDCKDGILAWLRAEHKGVE